MGKRRRLIGFTLLIGIAVLVSGVGLAQGQKNPLDITIYNQGFAYIKDERTLMLQPGLNLIEWDQLPQDAEETSFKLHLGEYASDVKIWEQSFSSGSFGQYEFLVANRGKWVSLVLEDGQELSGTLVSAEHGQVLVQTLSGLVSINQSRITRVQVRDDAEGLITTPTYSVQLYSNLETAKTIPVGFSYLVRGIQWQADYRLEWDEEKRTAFVEVWATIANHTNRTFEDGRLSLVAGEVSREELGGGPIPYLKDVSRAESSLADTGINPVSRGAFSEYHLYTVKQPTTIKAFQTKQVRLAEPLEIQVEKNYRYDYRESPDRIQVLLKVQNEADQGSGIPLPAGTVKIFSKDAQGRLRLAGEDHLTNLPVGEEAELALGYAFDLSVNRKQTESARPTEELLKESYLLEFKNSGDKNLTVTVREHLDKGDSWEITKANQDYEKIDAHTVEFEVDIPAQSSTTLEYAVTYLTQAYIR